MDVQTNGTVNPAQATEPSGEQEQSVSELVDNFFQNIPKNIVGRQREAAKPEQETETAEASQETKTEAAAAQPAEEVSPLDARIAELTDKLSKSQKSYDNLQSTVDGRIHAATKDLREQVAETNKLVQQLLLRMANPGQEPNYYEEPKQQTATGPTEEQLRQIIANALANDPKLAKSSALSELLEFRADKPDAERYNLFTQKVLEKFPELRQSRGIKGALESLYELGQDLELTQLQMAKAMEEAAKIEAQKQTTQTTKTNGRLSVDEAKRLAERANALTNEQGISSSPNPRPKLDRSLPYNKKIDAVVDAWMRKIGA